MTRNSYISLLLVLLSAFAVRAGERILITGSLDGQLSGGMVVLEQYAANNYMSLASQVIEDDLAFEFGKNNDLEPGLYRISIHGMDLAQIFYLGAEGANANFFLQESGKMPRVEIESAEQDRYGSLQYQMMESEMAVSSAIRAINALDPFDPQWMSKTDSLEKLIDEAIIEKNKVIDRFIAENEGSFTAEVLAPMAKLPVRNDTEKYETRKSYTAQHLLDFIPWENPYVFNSREAAALIHDAFMSYTPYSEEAIVQRINAIMQLVQGDEEGAFNVAGIISEFLILNKAPVSTFEELAMEYFGTCESGSMFPEACAWVQNMQAMSDGYSIIPERSLPLVNGEPASIRLEVAGDYVLGFWSPDCPKCLKALPDVISYQQETQMPMHLIAIGGENELVEKLLESYEYKGRATILEEGWGDPLIQQLQVSTSPEFLYVSAQHEIVGRSNSIEDLKKITTPN